MATPGSTSTHLQLPSLLALRAFVAVGQTGSIRKAGQMLNIDHSAVSRHVRFLEMQLGVTLFVPRGRGLSLSTDGERYYNDMRKAFDIMVSATANLVSSQSRSLTISAPPAIAHRILLPRIPDLETVVPGWNITLVTGEESDVNKIGANVLQIGFRETVDFSTSDYCQLISRPRILPLASADALKSWPEIHSPHDIFRVPIILQSTNGYWEKWFAALGINDLPVLKGPNLPNTLLAIEAARRGQGVALVNETIAGDLVQKGELQEVLQTDVRLAGYYLTMSKSLATRPQVMKVMQWLRGVV